MEALCSKHGMGYKRLPALALPTSKRIDKKWLAGVGAVASLRHCVGLATADDAPWGLVGVSVEWQSCHRAQVADALCQLGI